MDGATAHHAAYRAQLVEWILDACAGERYGPCLLYTSPSPRD